jgi:hypothetical protein
LPEVVAQGFTHLLDEVYRSGKAFIGRAVPVELEQRAGRRQRHPPPRRRSWRTIGQLTGGVAHDFNNVLQVIGRQPAAAADVGGNLAAAAPEAQRRCSKPPLRPTAAPSCRRSCWPSRGASRCSRWSTKSGPRRLRGMDDLLRRALGETIEIETVRRGGLWNTMVDPHQLENVILNLAINARDAMPGGGRLTLELGNALLDDSYVAAEPDMAPGQYVMLAVSDTGSGMSREVLARAFEPFFTTKPEGEGTGLGLSMAYGFVKQSGGHIRIYSEVGTAPRSRSTCRADAAGTVERARLTRRPGGGRQRNHPGGRGRPGRAGTVVDMLGSLGYRVLKADNARAR